MLIATYQKHDELSESLNLIHPEVYDSFFQTLTFWYKDSVTGYGYFPRDEVPNIDDLIETDDGHNPYMDMIYGHMCESICKHEGWEDDEDYETSSHIISSNPEYFSTQLRKDVKKVFDAFQITYWENYVLEDKGDEVYWRDGKLHNCPLQEVW